MVTYYGLDKEIGNMSYFDSTGQTEYSFTKPYSEKTAEVIDQQVSKLISDAYQRAKDIITDNKEKVLKLGDLLLANEVVFSDDLETIFGKRENMNPDMAKASDFIEKTHEASDENEQQTQDTQKPLIEATKEN